MELIRILNLVAINFRKITLKVENNAAQRAEDRILQLLRWWGFVLLFSKPLNCWTYFAND